MRDFWNNMCAACRKIYEFFNSEIYIATSLLVFFISDIFNFFFNRYDEITIYNSLSFYPKGVFLVISLLYVIRRKQGHLPIMLMFFFLGLSYIGFLLLNGNEVLSDVNGLNYIKQSFKYFAPIIFFIHYKNMNRANVLTTSKNVFKCILVVSSVIVLISFLLKLEYFSTYNLIRFGYKPPIKPHNDVTLFWMIGLIFLYKEYLVHKTKISLYTFLIVVTSSMVLGTKAIVFFLFLFFSFILFTMPNLKNFAIVNKIKWILLLCITLALYFYFTGIYVFFKDIYIKEGIFSSLFSYRIDHFVENMKYSIDRWGWINYFIGGSVKSFPLVEMDLIDLFLYSGIIGVFLYYLIYVRVFILSIKNNEMLVFFIFSFFLIGAIAGHCYASGINSTYIAFLVVYLK